MPRRWNDGNVYFPPSQPRQAKGGIKAQSQRGAFGKSWWARRWIALLEGFGIGARLRRGGSYARRGQVLSVAIEKGLAKARVQGSRPKPYDVTIKVKTLSAADWKKLARTLSHQAIFAAKLLAGEMPQEMERLFGDIALSLFPEKSRDLDTNCSCPDWSNPCKHIAAVYYLLGEEFDRDPFLIFKLRGMNREELVELLGGAGEKNKARKIQGRSVSREIAEEVSLAPEPLTSDISGFWGGGELPEALFREVRVPALPAALVKRLGSFPFWRGEQRFLEAIEAIYIQASPHGMDIFLAQLESPTPSPRAGTPGFPD